MGSGDRSAEAEPDRQQERMWWQSLRPFWGEGEQNESFGPAVQLKIIVRLVWMIVVTANATPKAIEERKAKLRREGKTLPASGLSIFLTIERRGCDRIMTLLRRR